jgi:hypothetical protein
MEVLATFAGAVDAIRPLATTAAAALGAPGAYWYLAVQGCCENLSATASIPLHGSKFD